jgi:hypothetical protein
MNSEPLNVQPFQSHGSLEWGPEQVLGSLSRLSPNGMMQLRFDALFIINDKNERTYMYFVFHILSVRGTSSYTSSLHGTSALNCKLHSLTPAGFTNSQVYVIFIKHVIYYLHLFTLSLKVDYTCVVFYCKWFLYILYYNRVHIISRIDKLIIIYSILLVFLYGSDDQFLTSKEEHNLQVLENKILEKIFGTKRSDVFCLG